MPLPICGRALNALHCTILAEKKAQHGNMSGVMEGENTCLQPGCSSDADSIKTAPRLFTMSLHTNKPRLTELPCPLLRTATDAGRRERTEICWTK